MIFAFAIACSFFHSFLFFLCTFCTGHLRCHFSLANRSMCGGGKGMWCVGVSKHNAYLPSTSPCQPAGLLFRQPISFYYLLQLVFGPRQASRPGQAWLRLRLLVVLGFYDTFVRIFQRNERHLLPLANNNGGNNNSQAFSVWYL